MSKRLMTLLTAAIVLGLGPSSLRPAESERPYLEAAVRAARWLEATARVDSRGTSWPVAPSEDKTVQADLYSGVAGTLLFFLEMSRATGERSYLDRACSAADFIRAELDSVEDPGLYTGTSGLAYALEETYKLSREPRYRRAFHDCLDRIKSRAVKAGKGIEWGPVTDIIAGGSGIGLFLLYASQELGDASLEALAEQAGERLIELGRPEAGGLKWAMSPDYPRLMPNFSHGTAGVAYFLATLFQRSGKREHLEAALAGARYLTAVADTTGGGCLIFHDEPDNRDLYYLGWCHGPAGTARLFARLLEVTGDAVWKGWLTRAALSVLHSGIPEKQTPGFWNNVGMCCGTAGVADFMLDAYRLCGDTAYRDFAERLTASLLARAEPEDGGIKWTQAEHRTRPDFLQAQTGLMQGAAGIGLWLLRLDELLRARPRGIVLPDDPFLP
jgi:lantibiotic modifying enzyme